MSELNSESFQPKDRSSAPHHKSDADQSPENLPSVQPEIAEQIHAFNAQLFVAEGEVFLHRAACMVMHLAIDREQEQLMAERRDDLLPLRDEMRDLINQADQFIEQLDEQLKSDNTRAVAHLMAHDYAEWLPAFTAALEKVHTINLELLEARRSSQLENKPGRWSDADWEARVKDEYESAREREDSLKQWIEKALQGYTYDQEREHVEIDVNNLLFDLMDNRPGQVGFAEFIPALSANPDELKFALGKVWHTLIDTAWKLNQKAVKEIMQDDRTRETALCRWQSEDADLTKADRLGQALFSEVLPPQYFNKRGEYNTGLEVPEQLAEDWEAEVPRLEERLAAVRAVVESYGGELECSFRPRRGIFGPRVEVVIKLPLTEFEPADESFMQCGRERFKQEREAIPQPTPVFRPIRFVTKIQDKDDPGVVQECTVDAPGGVFTSPNSRQRLGYILQHAGHLLRVMPKLASITLKTDELNDEERFTQEFANLDCEITISDASPVEERNRNYRDIINDSYPWEDAPKRYREAPTSQMMSDKGSRLIMMSGHTLGSLAADPLLERLFEKVDSCTLVLKCENEHGYDKEGEVQVVRRMLADLVRVVEEVAERGDYCHLGLEMMRLGGDSHGPIFSVRLFDNEQRLVANASFMKEQQKFSYAYFPSVDMTKTIRAVEPLLRSLEGEELTFRNLDRLLQARQLDLPEDLLMGFVQAAQECGHADRDFDFQDLYQAHLEFIDPSARTYVFSPDELSLEV